MKWIKEYSDEHEAQYSCKVDDYLVVVWRTRRWHLVVEKTLKYATLGALKSRRECEKFVGPLIRLLDENN